MTSRTLRVELHTYWLCGSGRGDGPGADEVPLLTPEGLPFLPGRTLRGLLRAAVEVLGAVDPDHFAPGAVSALFGSSPDGRSAGEGAPPSGDRARELEEARFLTTPGTLQIGSATLGRTEAEELTWRRWAATHGSDERAPLFTRLASTSLDAGGVAKDRTLRSVEVVVPVTLYAPVEAPDEGMALLEAALPLVRALGSMRSRGFGRVSLAWDASGEAGHA